MAQDLPSVCLSVCALIPLELNICEASKPNAVKFYLNHHFGGRKEILLYVLRWIGLQLWFPFTKL